jgi:predicted outer membrane repeat protein
MGQHIGRDWRFARASGRMARAGRRRLRPSVLVLEGRRLLASLVVSSLDDTLDGSGAPTAGTLRWAVEQADKATSASTIEFDPSVFGAPGQTITLMQGPLKLSNANYATTIDGPTAGVTVSGGGASEVFGLATGTTASLSGLTITGASGSYFGGGISDFGNLALTDCTISGNSATRGGGIFCEGDTTLSLTNCTISGNDAQDGGGLFAEQYSTVIDDCTISGNTSPTNGAGIHVENTTEITNTIIAGNDSTDVYATPGLNISVTLDNDLVGNTVGIAASGTNNIVTPSPMLAPLGDYGGPTETIALLPGSPAIGAGTAVANVTTDQRGAPRFTGGGIDIGAFQDLGYTVNVISGYGQSTLIGTPFAQPLVATLTENYANDPIPGATITFKPPPGGAGATLGPPASVVTDASGQASITAVANAEAGIYIVSAQDAATPIADAAAFVLTNDAPSQIRFIRK